MEFIENRPLSAETTFKIGGPARWYCRPQTPADVKEALEFARARALPFFILGRGSNVLVADTGYDGLVIHMADLVSCVFDKTTVHAGAGIAIATLAATVARQGLDGLAFAGGLPGSLGGAIYMNARAYGGEIADVVASVEVVTPEGNIIERPKAELEYAYKHSALMQSGDVVIGARLTLATGNPDEIEARTETNRKKRVEQGQFVHPNAGCIFKNDYACGIPSGKLIDEAGLIGTAVGDAAVYERHANFIVNRGHATAAEIRELIEIVRRRVREERGIVLEEELRYLGFD